MALYGDKYLTILYPQHVITKYTQLITKYPLTSDMVCSSSLGTSSSHWSQPTKHFHVTSGEKNIAAAVETGGCGAGYFLSQLVTASVRARGSLNTVGMGKNRWNPRLDMKIAQF